MKRSLARTAFLVGLLIVLGFASSVAVVGQSDKSAQADQSNQSSQSGQAGQSGQSTGAAQPSYPDVPPPPQAAAAKPPAFDIADIEISVPRRFPYMSGGDIRGGRYVTRDATMVDLITAAYGVDSDHVLGGPAWLETDRYEVIAKASPITSPDTLKLMLQSLLADRFRLVIHTDTKPLQVYVLTAPGKPKFKESSGAGNTGCQPQNENQPPNAVPENYIICHGMTMDALATTLQDFAGGYFDRPVVNSTGLDGTYDMELKWTPRGALSQAGETGTTVFDAVDKQLGLKVELQKIPRPVIVVDSANEKPTANSPDVAKILPPAPPAAFDVAVIKPSAPNTNLFGRIDGAQLTLQGATLKFLINFAWDLNESDDEMLVNQPKWIEADHWDIIAKADVQPDANGKPAQPRYTQEDLQQMLRVLLMDRFKMQAHMEDRPISAYTLVADKPKLAKGDPSDRTRCFEGPAKTERIRASPIRFSGGCSPART